MPLYLPRLALRRTGLSDLMPCSFSHASTSFEAFFISSLRGSQVESYKRKREQAQASGGNAPQQGQTPIPEAVVGIWGFVTQSQIPNLLLENKKGFLQKFQGFSQQIFCHVPAK